MLVQMNLCRDWLLAQGELLDVYHCLSSVPFLFITVFEKIIKYVDFGCHGNQNSAWNCNH